MSLLRAVVACLLLFIVSPCQSESASAKTTDDVIGQVCFAPIEILHSQHSGCRESLDALIETPEAWCDFWDEAHAWIFPSPPCDPLQIDFDREVVVVAALGWKRNMCYGVAVPKVCREGTGLRVLVVEVEPGEGCHCNMAVVHPVVALRVPRPVTHVSFVHHTSTTPCGPF